MELQLEVNKLKEYIDIIIAAGRVTDAKLIFNPGGLECRALDPSHVAMVDLKLPKEEFVKYNLKEEIRTHVDLTMLKKMLGKMKDEVKIKHNSKENTLQLHAGRAKFELETLDSYDLPEVKIPNINFPGMAEVPVAELSEALKSVLLVCDLIQIGLTPNKLQLEGKTGKNGAVIWSYITATPSAQDLYRKCIHTLHDEYNHPLDRAEYYTPLSPDHEEKYTASQYQTHNNTRVETLFQAC